MDKWPKARYRLGGLNPPKTIFPPALLPRLSACAWLLLLPVAAGWAHGSDHELIAEASRAIAAQPDDATRYLHRAFLQLEHGDWKAAVLDAGEAERRRPGDADAALLRGRSLQAGGMLAEARAVLDRLAAAHPESAAVGGQRARVLAALGETNAAADEYARALALVPRPEPDQLFELTDLLARAGRHAEALAALDRSMVQTGALPVLVDRAVELEMTLGRPEAALRRMDAVIVAARVPEPLLAKRAALLARAGRTPESLAAWQELQQRLLALPEPRRSTAAMLRLLEQARQATGALASFPTP